MGGVDRLDQNINHLRIRIGGKKWYHCIITWLLDTAVQNAWQLHRKSGGNLSALAFRREIVCVLLRSTADLRNRTPSGGRVSTPGEEDIRFDGIGHFVVVRRDMRRVCAYQGCKTRCQTFCDKCDRSVCVDHFKEYHTGTVA